MSNQISRKGKNMIAIASGKSGAGKTWFAITLAQALSGFKQKTLFFDGDLGLANINIQLGLQLQNDIGEVIKGSQTLNQIIHKTNKVNFDIISGRSTSANLDSMPIGRLQLIGGDLALLAAGYDKIILDLGSGTPARIFAGQAAKVLILCTDEKASLEEAFAFIRVMHNHYPNSDLQIIINQAIDIRDGQRTYETLLKACRDFLKISPPLLGIIRRDARVRDAIRSQTPLLTRYLTSEAAEDVLNIARKLV